MFRTTNFAQGWKWWFYSGRKQRKNRVRLLRQISLSLWDFASESQNGSHNTVFPEAGRKTMPFQWKNCTHTTKCHSQSGVSIQFPLPNLWFFSLISWLVILDSGRVYTRMLWPDVCIRRGNWHVLFLIYTSRFTICHMALGESHWNVCVLQTLNKELD